MYKRSFRPPTDQSYFLLGARGVGKSSFIKKAYPRALVFDLLKDDTYNDLLAAPQRLSEYIPRAFKNWVVIDEIQKIPTLLNEVHRLIEGRGLKFVLTGSSFRKLKSKNVNLLAGRALTESMYPLTAQELGVDFNLKKSLQCGHLPMAYRSKNSKKFLASYVRTYLTEEVKHEALTRSLPSFSRFLEAASFSQGGVLNISNVARDCSVPRKVVESYFSILQDTLLSYELLVFRKKSRRKLLTSKKFYFFDVGVFQSLRPRGPLDEPQFLGVSLETLVLQEIMAQNAYKNFEYNVFYWRTHDHAHEVDFVLYGPRGLQAIEVKASTVVRSKDLKSLLLFLNDYPKAKGILLYMGTKKYVWKGVHIVPLEKFLKNMSHFVAR